MRAVSAVTLSDTEALIGACASPSEAFWRILEIDALRRCIEEFAAPVLELGCGDGVFTELLGVQIAFGTDREPRAVERASKRPCYEEVELLDIHDIGSSALGSFKTIYANSVLEHVPNLEAALPAIRDTLEPGGALITTVPLFEMNRHLLA